MTIAIYIILSIFLPFIWFLYFYRQDKVREPFKWLLLAFFLGGLAIFPSFYLQSIFHTTGFFKSEFFLYLISAFVEEFFKFFLIWAIIFRKQVFDEAIDGIIYMSVSALGFAVFENLFLYLQIGKEFESALEIYSTPIVRFLGANFLHILASSLIGFGYTEMVCTTKKSVFLISFIAAVLLHFWYNILAKNALFFGVLPLLWAAFFIVLSEIGHLKSKHGGFLERRTW